VVQFVSMVPCLAIAVTTRHLRITSRSQLVSERLLKLSNTSGAFALLPVPLSLKRGLLSKDNFNERKGCENRPEISVHKYPYIQ